MAAQKSCFTVHGINKRSLAVQLGPECLKEYTIDRGATQDMLNDLRLMGISQSSLYPDLEGLAKELANLF